MENRCVPLDDGRSFPFTGEAKIRALLADTKLTDKEKDAALHLEWGRVADYYNWVFDRISERKNHEVKKLHSPAVKA